MPNRWAVANGNWSDPTTWSGSLIPTASDDVFANNRTVNVDTSFQVLSIRNTASASAVVAGGSFNFSSGSISGSMTSATGIVAGATNLITVTAGSGTVTISAPLTTVTGLTGLGANNQTINHTGACNFIITASNFVAGSDNPTYAINKSSTGLLSVLGNVVASNASSITPSIITSAGNTIVRGNVAGSEVAVNGNNGISHTGGTLTVIGNVTGGSSGFSGLQLNTGITSTGTSLTITGSITGGSGAPAITCTSAANIQISGSISGGSSTSTGIGLSCTAAAVIIITGSVTALNATGIQSTGASTLTFRGPLTSANNVPAIISSNASATNIFTGPFINTNDTMAVQCADMMLTADASTSWNFGNITLYSPAQLAYYPSASDIRQGTTYADGTVSGSLKMPPATAVVAGIPTDNTTGSAVLTPSQLQDAVWGRDLSQMTETGSIGHRLARVSTTGTTGAQIASYLL